MKKNSSKLLYLLAGIVLIVLGGWLAYLEITGHHRKWQKYPFIILGVGIVTATMAFVKDEKPKSGDQKTGP